MPDNLIQEEMACEECGATMEIHHNETIDPRFCPFCRYEMLIYIDKDEDAPWADLEDNDDVLEDEEDL